VAGVGVRAPMGIAVQLKPPRRHRSSNPPLSTDLSAGISSPVRTFLWSTGYSSHPLHRSPRYLFTEAVAVTSGSTISWCLWFPPVMGMLLTFDFFAFPHPAARIKFDSSRDCLDQIVVVPSALTRSTDFYWMRLQVPQAHDSYSARCARI
jgi:hypothetical protein